MLATKKKNLRKSMKSKNAMASMGPDAAQKMMIPTTAMIDITALYRAIQIMDKSFNEDGEWWPPRYLS